MLESVQTLENGQVNSDSSTWLGRGLNLFGITVVTFSYSRVFLDGVPPWVVALGYLSLAAWLARVLVPRRFTAVTVPLLVVMAVCGGVATVPTTGLLVVPVAVAILRMVGDLLRPLWLGISLTASALVVVAAGELISTLPTLGLISIEGGVVIATLAGVSRRQFRVADQQALAARVEQAHALVLAERQSVASDIHDVLAHSLGGLVIQLDAVEALLDAGRIEDAAARAHDARVLAVSGLAEARRAVGALRDASTAPVHLPSAIADFVRAHRSLGGVVELKIDGAHRPLSAAAGTAMVRTVQESLTNARKHAPGQPVVVSIHWTADGASLEIANGLGESVSSAQSGFLAQTGGGHGIEGMTKRFAALPGATLTAGRLGSRFVVTARVAS